jgi:Domain of unknown function (DUF5615)
MPAFAARSSVDVGGVNPRWTFSADDANLAGVPDPEVLALAAEQDRILVSHDFQTMPRHFAEFLQARGSSPGLILVPQYLPIGEAVEELLVIWGASEAEEWQNRMLKIPLP